MAVKATIAAIALAAHPAGPQHDPAKLSEALGIRSASIGYVHTPPLSAGDGTVVVKTKRCALKRRDWVSALGALVEGQPEAPPDGRDHWNAPALPALDFAIRFDRGTQPAILAFVPVSRLEPQGDAHIRFNGERRTIPAEALAQLHAISAKSGCLPRQYRKSR